MRRHFFYAFLMAILLAPAVLADQIVLKNGDRFTGAIAKSDGKTIVIQSELAGAVTVPLDTVTQITADQPMYLALKDAQTIVGAFTTTADGRFSVRTGETGTVTVARESVQSIRSKEEEDAYQLQLNRLRNPSLADLWSGTLDTALSLSRGNAETATCTIGFNAVRVTTRDKISVYMNTLYARNSTGGKSVVTANAKRGGARYDVNISSKVFGFGTGDLENDEFQKLDLRLTLGGGMGWHALKTERSSFDVFGGGALNREYFSTGLNRSSGEMLVGQEIAHKAGRTTLKERATFMPNMSDIGEYRFNFDASAVTLLNTWLSWTVNFSNRYVSNPVGGAKSNDILLSTGLRVTFGH
jgi:putative salt-induced outer membrane protein